MSVRNISNLFSYVSDKDIKKVIIKFDARTEFINVSEVVDDNSDVFIIKITYLISNFFFLMRNNCRKFRCLPTN